MIYRETITVAAKHLLEAGLRPPSHFSQAIESVKCSRLITNLRPSYLVPLNQCFSLACSGFRKAAYNLCDYL